MPKETTQAGIVGGLQRLQTSLDANGAEIPHLEGGRTKLKTLVGRAIEISNQQAVLTASRQQASKELKTILREAQRLANVLRLALKEHYGIQSEKLSEYGIQPFRGRARKASSPPEFPAASKPAPTPRTAPSTPENPA
jgi:hypothetical protein